MLSHSYCYLTIHHPLLCKGPHGPARRMARNEAELAAYPTPVSMPCCTNQPLRKSAKNSPEKGWMLTRGNAWKIKGYGEVFKTELLPSMPHQREDNEPGASLTTQPHNECIPGLELPLAWYRCHIQLENHWREYVA